MEPCLGYNVFIILLCIARPGLQAEDATHLNCKIMFGFLFSVILWSLRNYTNVTAAASHNIAI